MINIRVVVSVLSLLSVVCIKAQDVTMFPESTKVLKIEPSKTDSRISTANTPHFIAYNSINTKGKLLLFIPGTNGIALKGPMHLFSTAVEQGYAVINLSYINTPAIARICKGDNLIGNTDCAEEFRNRRVYGDTTFTLIEDMPYDAIVNRLTKLLFYLAENDKGGKWERYLENGEPKWNEIALAGQSQGGGMSAFIAKTHLVHRVIDFSGGWDYSAKNKIAKWYFKSSKTPLDRWYGTYHVKEPTAHVIIETYEAMEIPESNVYAFDLEVPQGKRAHSNGVRNLGYKDQWVALLGKGN
ncbi:hypothetical protein LCGC14_0239460 [marine sediment metagenome]|uniref:Alpha/beta hydrolase n=1 Tax=marine sediment metagenome TaxID=412755 RepID=A0A0F9UCB9_9ZZZZ|nr:hypothetical protein [Maribacter sp.]HDZ04302.1 hypothetical protein [Maribacter sp.]HEA79404.1 hypothetical protein [Maribacter sp.]